MNRTIKPAFVALILIVLWSCDKKSPDPALPDYLQIPASLSGYKGSGLITIDGSGLTLRAEGAETLDKAKNTYSGVLGNVSFGEVNAKFTLGQPLGYADSGTVPDQYKANGALFIRGIATGTYPMNAQAPNPQGGFADLTLNLPGPQIYVSMGGTLTIDELVPVKTEGSNSLYRVKGSFQSELQATGIGTNPALPSAVTGTFDLLLASSL